MHIVRHTPFSLDLINLLLANRVKAPVEDTSQLGNTLTVSDDIVRAGRAPELFIWLIGCSETGNVRSFVFLKLAHISFFKFFMEIFFLSNSHVSLF